VCCLRQMKRFGYFIAGIIFLLLAFQVEGYLYCTADVEGDESVLLNEMRTDELSIIQTINSVNNNDDLQSIESIFNALPSSICYTYANQANKLVSWKGVIDDCQVIRSKVLPNGHTLTIGWLLLDSDKNLVEGQGLSQCYVQSEIDSEILLDGNIRSLRLASQKQSKRPSIGWLISFLFLISFLSLLRGIALQSSIVTYVSTPLLYLLYADINQRWFGQVAIHHETSLHLTPWAPSLVELFMLTCGLYLINLKGISKKYTERKELSIAVHLIAVLMLLIGIILSFYHFIHSPSVRINFNELSTLSLVEGISIICLVSWTLILFMRTQLLIRETKTLTPLIKYACFVGIALFTLIAAGIPTGVSPYWVLPLFVIVYLILNDLYFDIGAKNITWLILWLVVMSAFLSTLLYRYDFERDIHNRKASLEAYFQEVDLESLDACKQIQSNKFDSIKQHILTHPHLGQIDALDMIQSTFDPIENVQISVSGYTQDSTSIYTNHSLVHDQHLHWLDLGQGWTFDPIINTYRATNHFQRGENRITHYTDYTSYSYGRNIETPLSLIVNGQLTTNQLELSDDDIMELMSSDNLKHYIASDLYLTYRPYDEIIAVTRKPIFSILKPITLFSFFFCLLTILVILFMILNSTLDFLPDYLPLRFSRDAGLSTRIQIIIVGMVIFSFITIATITSIYLQSQIIKNENKETQNRIRAISNTMLWHLKDIDESKNTAYFLENIRGELERIHDVEIQLFDTEGRKVSEQSATAYLPYIAYHYFNKLQQNNPLTLKEMQLEKSYIPFKSGKTNEQIYASLEYNGPDTSSLGVVDYLGTLLNVYVFLFLIAGAVALAIARSITEPLETLANRMKQTKLNKKNIPVEWKADDEIGKLIKNYNSMITQLEDSAQLIARTERDVAWKEMARNVAHEIKNPLTPMKLSIQYLERAVKQNPDQAKPLVKRISSTLIEQIDNLAQIADAFSNFGKMPQAKNEKVILNEVVETIHDLFRKRDDMNIKMSEPIEDLLVFADKNHLISILNNLLKNAIQSIPNNRAGAISIDLYKEDDNAIIKVSDNGVGIPNAMKDKIFTPNFTTKSSGSGLGLAISSNMIEAFNGKMYFDSIEGVGSKFYIAIPLMKHVIDRDDPDIIVLED